MLISEKYKFIFVHNPKTAGSSIENVLLPYSNFYYRIKNRSVKYYIYKFLGDKYLFGGIFKKHTPASRIQRVIPAEKFESYFKFSFIRNPYSRVFSYYNYLKTNNGHDQQEWIKNKSFEEYVLNIPNQRWKDLQSYYLYDENENLIVDFLGKFETLEADFQIILQKLDLKCTLPHINSSVNSNLNNPQFFNNFTKEMIKVINDEFHDDFRLLGYNKIKVKA